MNFIKQKIFSDFVVEDAKIPIIQGILNLSPESFYKDSVVSRDEINGKVKNFIDNGVKILDIGARSTAPGVTPITREEELDRIKPFLEKLVDFIPKDIIISIDTQFSEIAEYCIKFCNKNNIRCMVNDVSGLKTDSDMAKIVIDYDVPLILMASHQRPGDLLSVNAILESIFNSINELDSLNYNLEKLIIDPGIGKWIPEKTYEYDLSIIDNLERFRCFGHPILVGISRKSFIGTTLGGKSPQERFNGTLAATTIAVYNGAHIIRTHDIDTNLMEMIQMAHAIRKKPLIINKNGVSGSLIGFIRDPLDARYLMRRMGVTPAGSRIMDKKTVSRVIMLENVTAPQALILKQELLARGGDCAIHKNVVTTENAKYDAVHNALLIGTEKQMGSLAQKLKGQQLELDKMSAVIETLIEKSKEDKFLHSI